MPALDDLAQQGKLRYVGASNPAAWHVDEREARSGPLRLPPAAVLLTLREIEHEILRPIGRGITGTELAMALSSIPTSMLQNVTARASRLPRFYPTGGTATAGSGSSRSIAGADWERTLVQRAQAGARGQRESYTAGRCAMSRI